MKKCQKNPKKSHYEYLDASDLRFYSIILKFDSQVHKEFY